MQANPIATVLEARPVAGSFVVDPTDNDAMPSAAEFVDMFESSEDASYEARQLAERDRDYVDNIQLTAEEIAALTKRKQPPIVINRIKRKVDFLKGYEMGQRVDPRALPRTPQHEEDASGVEQALRYVADDQRFDHKRSRVWDNLLVEGAGGYRVGVKESYDGLEITIDRIPWDRMFWDPHSSEPDFSDAGYVGLVRWLDRDEAVREYADNPNAESILTETLNNASVSDTFDDKPRWKVWADRKRRRVRVCQVWHRKGDEWHFAEFTKGGVLRQGPSPHQTDKGESDCELIFGSAYVNRDNDRYGIVREMIGPQDEINKRRSKALHLLNVSQVTMEQGAVDDIEKFRRETARPDGVKVVNPGFFDKIRDDTRVDLATGHLNLLQEAKGEIDMMAGNIALQGNALQKSAASGKAIIASQQGGAMEVAPLLDALRDMDIRVFRAIWARIRQYWTGEKWVRVTDDERNIKWLGLNVDPMRAQMAMQDPAAQEKIAGVVGNIAELDCDIIIDDAPDGLTPQLEQFQSLVELKKMDANGELPFRAILMAMPNLKNKQQVLAAMDEAKQGANPEQQAAMQQAQLQQMMMVKQAENQVMLQAEQQKSQIAIETKKAEAQIDLEQHRVEAEIDLQMERQRADQTQDVEAEGVRKKADADGTSAVVQAIGALVENSQQSNAAIVQAVQMMAQAAATPKRVVRDPVTGRVAGVEAVI
jgi:hypothetical protein